MRSALLVVSIWLIATIPTLAQDKKKKIDPAFEPIQDNPKLPRVLLIGDSISIGYTLPTREILKDKVNVHRIPTNGGPTSNGLKNLKSWLGNSKWDAIHFNWGLHDIKLDADGKHQVPIDQYEKNLRELVVQLKATGAKLIWANTTPVPEGKVNPPRRPDDVSIYNAVAKKVMSEHGVAINDLFGFAMPRLKEIQMPVNVHFTEKGSRELAGRVADAIERSFSKRS
ncbi:MAG: SGNH/GDSL hydrolase family protein [Gemmataceae bacterium]|nr:SGNH/GDSL hydrolase family protein [Gemmataceae bacterium]